MADKPNLIDSGIDYNEVAQDIRESYQAMEGQNLDRSDVLPPTDRVSTGSDIANILFGDEMATVGVSLDRNGFKWSMDKAAHFWSEHPVKAAWSAATALAPALGAMKKFNRAGELAKLSDSIVAEAGYLDDVNDISKVAEKDLELMKVNINSISNYKERIEKIEMLGDQAPFKDRVYSQINKLFTNTYHNDIDPLNAYNARAEWTKSVSSLLKEDGRLTNHLKNLPPDDPILGLKITKYLSDPNELKNIPDKYKPFVVDLGNDFFETQSAAVKEGMISPEESTKVGKAWFSTVREGTQIDSDKFTTITDRTSSGAARILKVPKTYSINLLDRAASKKEVEGYIEKQHAAELISAGKTDEALSLLSSKEGFADAKKLVEDGEYGTAIKLLTSHGKIDFTPKSLTFNSLFNQKVLLGNYRMIRDLAMNSDVTLSSEKWATLAPSVQKNYMKLDTLSGSDRLRRMVGVAKGIDPDTVSELGWVPKSTFRELKEMTDGSMNDGLGGLLSFLTAIHKVASTAFNIPTHFQNMGGNFAFLVGAGVNPFSSNFIDLQKKSASAVWQLLQANRKGENILELKNLGKVKSLINDAKEFDIADELNSSELESLIEKSSILSSEGIGVLEKISKSNNFVGDMAKLANKVPNMTGGYLAADLYSTEDAMVKMAYFMNLRQRGFSRAAAAIEVGKRLPMYHSIGAGPKSLRSWALPWISFPAETARILKNNSIDHPLKTAMLLQFPDFAQLGAYGAARLSGRPMSYEGIQQRKEGLASWANRPSTIMTPILDRNKDFRSMILDFLPYSSLGPATMSKDAPLFKQLPFGADEPMPILSGLYQAMTGKDAWGREIPTDPNKPSQKVAVLANSFMGFISPPFMNKYLFNTSDPEVGYRFLADMGKNVNPNTEKAGDPVFDLFLNNILNLKMYPSSPEQELSNEAFKKRALVDYRSRLTKDWTALLKNGDVDGAAQVLKDIRETFVEEWKDPQIVQAKEVEYLKSHTNSIRGHPQLRGFSKEEIQYQLQDKMQASANARTGFLQQLIEAHRNELARRGRNSKNGTKNPFLPDGME